jgi:hypothetical protein
MLMLISVLIQILILISRSTQRQTLTGILVVIAIAERLGVMMVVATAAAVDCQPTVPKNEEIPSHCGLVCFCYHFHSTKQELHAI